MPTRDDDDLDVMSGLSASRDDAAKKPSKQRSAPPPKTEQQATQRHAPEQQKPASSSRASTAQPAAKSGSGLIWMLFLLLIVVIGACVWLGQQVLQLQEQQAASNSALQLERSRVESISAQVHETDSSFVETGNVLESKFKFYDSEIRKLWAVSYDRNRKSIADNKAQLATAEKATKAAQAKLKTLEGKLAGTTKTTEALSSQTEKLNKLLVSENTALRATVEAQNEQLLILEGEFELLQERIKNLPSDLVNRVAENEEAVQAIDASRQQIINRLTRLQQELDALRRPAAP